MARAFAAADGPLPRPRPGPSPASQGRGNCARGVRALADVVPGARHRTLDGQTHLVKPAALAPVLAEFFQGATVNGGGSR